MSILPTNNSSHSQQIFNQTTEPPPKKTIGEHIQSAINSLFRGIFGGVRNAPYKPYAKQSPTSVSSLTIVQQPRPDAAKINPQMRSPDAQTTKANINNAGKTQTSRNEVPAELKGKEAEVVAFSNVVKDIFYPATKNPSEIHPSDLDRLETLGKKLKSQCDSLKKAGIGVDFQERIISRGLENIAAAKRNLASANSGGKIIPSIRAPINAMNPETLAHSVGELYNKCDKFYSATRDYNLISKKVPDLESLKGEGLVLKKSFEALKDQMNVVTQLRHIDEGLRNIQSRINMNKHSA